MSERSPQDTLLLDVMQGVGRIAGQNELILQEQGNASRDRKEQYHALEQIRANLTDVKNNVETLTSRVTVMEPDVTKMKAFRSQIALAVFFVTSAVTGAINLIWIAVTHMGEIKSALREFMR